jgi:hypothetical protein
MPEDGFSSFLNPENILAKSPQMAYFSFQNQFGRTPTQRGFFQGQFQNFFNQYLGNLGQQLRGTGGQPGQVPTNTFSDFLEQNLGQQYAGLPPSVRGMTTSRFAPQARFLNY